MDLAVQAFLVVFGQLCHFVPGRLSCSKICELLLETWESQFVVLGLLQLCYRVRDFEDWNVFVRKKTKIMVFVTACIFIDGLSSIMCYMILQLPFIVVLDSCFGFICKMSAVFSTQVQLSFLPLTVQSNSCGIFNSVFAHTQPFVLLSVCVCVCVLLQVFIVLLKLLQLCYRVRQVQDCYVSALNNKVPRILLALAFSSLDCKI